MVRLASQVQLVSRVCLELMVTLAVQDLKDSEAASASRARMVQWDRLDRREVAAVQVRSGSLEIPETRETRAGLDSLVTWVRKVRPEPPALVGHKESLVRWASQEQWGLQDSVDRRVWTGSRAVLALLDLLETREIPVLLDKLDSRDSEGHLDSLATLVPPEILASMDSRVWFRYVQLFIATRCQDVRSNFTKFNFYKMAKTMIYFF